MPTIKSRTAQTGGYHSNMKEKAYAPLNSTGGNAGSFNLSTDEFKSATLRLPKTKLVSQGHPRMNDIMEAT